MTEVLEEKRKFSLEIFREMIRNGLRLTRLVWAERKVIIVALVAARA